MNPLHYFLHQSISHARTMGLPDARRFLAGLLELLGEERKEADELRQALIHLDESDKRLETLQTDQLNLL